MSVLVVLINYRRPQNLLEILPAVRAQSEPCKIVVVDNHPESEPECRLPSEVEASVDDVWRFKQNTGPSCRFAPALLTHDCEYVAFLDDDFVPAPRAIEHLLKTAKQVNDKFATIGEIGRIFPRAVDRGHLDYRYAPKNVTRTEAPRQVDMTCRAHFVRAELVRHALDLKWDLLRRYANTDYPQVLYTHDDILLCLGIQRATGYPSYMTPLDPTDTAIIAKELPGPNAVHHRPGHKKTRSRLVSRCGRLGWKTLVQDIN